MKILSLGTEISAQNGGLPEYLRYFAKVFGGSNEILFLSIGLRDLEREVEIKKHSPGVTEIIVNCPDFFEASPCDVFKYTNMNKAFDLSQKMMKPDIIITHDWFWTPVLKSFKLAAPLVFMVHFFYTYFNRKMGFQNPLQELSESGALDLAARTVANSEATMKDILTLFPEKEMRVLAAPLGVDKTKYPPVPNLESKIISYIGRLQGEKAINVFLADVHRNQPALANAGYEVKIAGKGAYLEMVVDMSMSGEIGYLGVIDEETKKELLKAEKYQVFPSLYEPWGLALTEALASGKICLVSEAGGHLEQVKDGKNGVVVKDGHFIEKIMELEKNPKLQERIAKEASKSAADIRDHFELLGRIFNDVIRSYSPAKK